MDHTISEICSICANSFKALGVDLTECVSQGLVATADYQDFEDAFDRFNLWAGNLGALHSGPGYEESLDYKLRHVPFYRNQVLKLLKTLKNVLQKLAFKVVETIAHGKHIASLGFDQGERSQGVHQPEEHDSPWEVSSDSEGEGSPELQSKIQSMIIDSDHRTPLDILSSLLESLGFIVTCLWRLPLPIPRSSHWVPEQMSTEPFEDEPSDLLHVWEKFPAIDTRVAKRLTKIMFIRRKSIRSKMDTYQREATISLSKRPAASSWGRIPPSPDATTQHLNVLIDESRQPQDLDILHGSDSISSTASERTTQAKSLTLPKRPRGKNGEYVENFRCPYCLTTQPITSEREWR